MNTFTTLVIAGMLPHLVAAHALAGHGTIRETDTTVIVEYYGDAGDTPVGPGSAPSPQPQRPGEPAADKPKPAGAAETIVQPQERDQRRQEIYNAKVSEKAAQRQRSREIRRQQQEQKRRQMGTSDSEDE